MKLTTVKIKKDKKFIEYIKIIREYDNNLSMAQIKHAMENDEIVFSFNPENNPIIHNGKSNTGCFLEEIFIKTLKKLKKSGADMIVMEGDRELLEFSKESSSKENIDKIVEQLFSAKDGSAASDIVEKLMKIAKKDNNKRTAIIEVLMKYSDETFMKHIGSFVVSDINELVNENETEYEGFYKSKIETGDSMAIYNAIKGYAKIMQKASYDYLIEILFSRKLDVECSALIVCELSHLSNNPFDQGSPWEMNEWKFSDLKLKDIATWKEAGYPDGNGYEDPIVHPCLENPNTQEEKVYAKLDNKLAKKREKNADKAHPSNWLIQGNKEDIERIQKEIKVPDNYLDFLMKASPLNVEIKLKGYGPIVLYGAHELIEMQGGYSFDPVENKKIEEWPENYIVIASCIGDPFCIEASHTNSPVYYAMHGMEQWEFEEAFPSLLDFLKALG